MTEYVKNYSKKREQALYDLVYEEIVLFRIEVLRGLVVGMNARSQEEVIMDKLGKLPVKVCERFKEKLK